MSQTATADTERFLRHLAKVQSAAEELFGGRDAAERIGEVCERFRSRCAQSFASRGIHDPLVAVIGLKGQGKSWVARSLVTDGQTRSLLPSGVLTREATTKVYWVGPQPPEALDVDREVFVRTPRGSLAHLGFDYTLLDTPGATDADADAAAIAATAVSMAPVVLLVTRQDQLRAEAADQLARRTGGSIVVPVITAVAREQQAAAPTSAAPTSAAQTSAAPASKLDDGQPRRQVIPSDDLRKRVEAWQASVSHREGEISWLPAVYVEDFEETGDEESARTRLAAELAARLSTVRPEAIAQSRGGRLRELRRQLRREVGQVISEEAPDVAAALRSLESQAAAIPAQAVEAVIGSPSSLRLALQRQLRGWAVADTPAIFFPYRTVLSVLSLTHGAWDRVVLAMTGSLPSLFGSVAAATRNAAEGQRSREELRAGLQSRIDAQSQSLIHPAYTNFTHALRRHAGAAATGGDLRQAEIRFRGTEQLQLQSAAILETELDRCRPRPMTLALAAAAGTALFWALFAGPIVAVYRDYLAAAYRSLVAWDLSIDGFPAPPVQSFVTAIVLSTLPLAVYCMAFLTAVLSRRRVRAAVERILRAHHRLIEQLQADDVLALDITDERLRSARFLIGLQDGGGDRLESERGNG